MFEDWNQPFTDQKSYKVELLKGVILLICHNIFGKVENPCQSQVNISLIIRQWIMEF